MLKKNFIYNLIYQIFNFMLPILIVPYISRLLGADGIGTYSYTQSVVSYFILAGTLGVGVYAQRETAFIQGDKENRSRIFWEINIFKFIICLISLAAYVLFCVYSGKYRTIYFIQVIDIIAAALDITWFYQGIEKFSNIVIRNICVKIISLLLIFSIVRNLYDYVLIMSATLLSGNCLLWVSIFKYTSKISFKELNVKKHIKGILLLFLPQIAIQLYTILDKTMIGLITQDMRENAYYEQANKIIQIPLILSTALKTVLLPRMSNYFHTGKIKKYRELFLFSLKYVYLIGFPLTFGLIGITKGFVPVFFGNEYIPVASVIYCLSPLIIIISLSYLSGSQYLIVQNKEKQYICSTIIGTFINLGINIIVINRLGAIGAAIASVLAELVIIVVQYYSIVKVDKFIDARELIAGLWKPCTASFFMYLIISKMGDNSLIQIMLQIAVGAVVYLLTLYILKEESLILLLKILKNKNIIF